jgi:hypothetical protein
MITLRLFGVASFGLGVDQEFENSGIYHNPERQRGILGNTDKTQKHNPSLTLRVGMVANSQLQNYGFGTSGVVASAAAGSAAGAGASGAIAVSQSSLIGLRSAVVSEPNRCCFESADSATTLIMP